MHIVVNIFKVVNDINVSAHQWCYKIDMEIHRGEARSL